ncbi:WavE lipopolysaccharide synthesis family protein [Pseudomonas sp. RIT623]|uniref:WavE lipopolysaccharide synthesis family protein n=1 Tax=Pseudomonas sp. RIT623 TaxID=2559075 RepID=UPI00106F547C|nr:WavE lipopolysaccharide synthesis family protein [Pseudomonas sp. RIT623]TFF33873.1 glycosyltransferase [Pseudomonas sp. RIT623]
MKIDSSEISVIIQGPIVHRSYNYGRQSITQAAVNSVRLLLPDAEIIVSTWAGEEPPSPLIDLFLENPDPGAQKASPESLANNVNRQIVSTVAGLKQATRKYCLKLRTDIVLKSIDFIETYSSDKFSRTNYSLFERRIVSNNLTSRNPVRYYQATPFFNWKLLFHISDHVHFGLKQDMLLLWDLPLQTKSEAEYFVERVHPERFRLNEEARLAPEQYIAVNCFKKSFDIDLIDYADWDAEKEKESEALLRSNFIFLEDQKFSIAFPKYHSKHESRFESIRYNRADAHATPTSKISPLPTKGRVSKVSVVMPVHNSWPYFENCVESILSQSYTNFELVLVNDHSTQFELLAYLEKLAASDSRVRVIDSKEKGANKARKLGISSAEGDYLLVMDSDDLLDHDAIQMLVSSAEKYNSDVVVFGFEVFDTLSENIVCSYTPHINKELRWYRADKAKNVTSITAGFNHTFWVHFFRRGAMDVSTLSLNLKYYEELPAIASLYSDSNIFSFVCAPLYRYRVGQSGQLTSAWSDVDREKKLKDLAHAIKICIENSPAHSPAQNFIRQKAFGIIVAEIGHSEGTDRFSQSESYELIKDAARSALGAPKTWLLKAEKKRLLYLLALSNLNRKNFGRALNLYRRIHGFVYHMAMGILTLIGHR